MKKLVMTVLLSMFIMGAQRQPTRAAYYYTTTYWHAMVDGVPLDLTEAHFQKKRNGIVKLNGAEFETTYTGMIKVSGQCSFKRDPVAAEMYLKVGDEIFGLIRSSNKTNAFSVVVPAGNMTITGIQYNEQAANGFFCNLLFEALK